MVTPTFRVSLRNARVTLERRCRCVTLERRFASDDALEFGVEDLSDQGGIWGILEDHPRKLTGIPSEELGYMHLIFHPKYYWLFPSRG